LTITKFENVNDDFVELFSASIIVNNFLKFSTSPLPHPIENIIEEVNYWLDRKNLIPNCEKHIMEFLSNLSVSGRHPEQFAVVLDYFKNKVLKDELSEILLQNNKSNLSFPVSRKL